MNNGEITDEFFKSKKALMIMTKDLVAEANLDYDTAQERLDAHHKELDNLMNCYGKLLKGFLNIRDELKSKEKEEDSLIEKNKEGVAKIESQLEALKT